MKFSSRGFITLITLIFFVITLLPISALVTSKLFIQKNVTKNISNTSRIANNGSDNSDTNSPPTIPPGYCGGENRTGNNLWADSTKPISCNYADTSYTPGTNNSYNNYCQDKYGNQLAYFYACTAGGGESKTTIICKDHNGVDGKTYPNGYFAPICMTTSPTAENYTSGKFEFRKAVANPNPYKDGKYYDVYQCVDSNTYDFIPKDGLSNICNKYPWVQNSSGTLPPPPSGTTCSDPKPYWDGVKCTYRPDACNNIGSSGKQNTCQATACGTGLDPDTRASKAEANLACVDAYGAGKGYCCLASTSAPVPGNPPNNPGGGGGSGNTCSNRTKDGTETDVDCGGGTCPTCTNGKFCSNGSDCQSNTCTSGICTASPGNPPNNPGGGTVTEDGNCTSNPDVCAPQFKCVSIGGSIKVCKYKNPSEPGAYCSSSSNHCSNSTDSCDQSGLVMGDRYACQRAGLGSYCCKGQASAPQGTSRVSSFEKSGTCITNSQCVTLGFKACVFTNNPLVGVCK